MPDSLYTCTAKDNPSTAGMENDDTDWFECFQTYREFLLDSINREYWEAYLDFDALEEWRNSPEPSED